ncbi:hypothetical protein M011DRAFT_469183 [Sporormia fimetaria CBS 119925]|uniref:Uncharacterized protein n=1 Tax=Sporormia fimetaria CBS 119925 TaxID=1340428 RepID=A0A6A6V5R9_9PLEO|nr:hypothetical protein M011DRAFT_469183 [Sporormia fimetaria CBS 119925]
MRLPGMHRTECASHDLETFCLALAASQACFIIYLASRPVALTFSSCIFTNSFITFTFVSSGSIDHPDRRYYNKTCPHGSHLTILPRYWNCCISSRSAFSSSGFCISATNTASNLASSWAVGTFVWSTSCSSVGFFVSPCLSGRVCKFLSCFTHTMSDGLGRYWLFYCVLLFRTGLCHHVFHDILIDTAPPTITPTALSSLRPILPIVQRIHGPRRWDPSFRS